MKTLIQKTRTWRPRERDVNRFTNGDCHILAVALHRATGWDLAGFTTEDYPDGPDAHAFVVHPSGAIIDIEGAHRPAEFLRRWQDEAGDDIGGWKTMTEADFAAADGWGQIGCFGDYSKRRARIMARRIIEHFDA